MEERKLPSHFQIGDVVGLQKLVDMLEYARDARIFKVSFLEPKVKYDLQIFTDTGGYFRLANIDSAFIHEPIVMPYADGDFYKWRDASEIPDRNLPPNQEYSVDILIDVYGDQEIFRTGHYQFLDNSWFINGNDGLDEILTAMKWRYILHKS